MSDYGTKMTDRAVRETERRLSRVYREAARDIKSKMKDWEKAHAEREKKYRQQVADGKITQADFDAWMRGQVFQGNQWKARQEQINQILLNADKAAAQIVNDGKMGVFAANANYVGYELERGVGARTGFNLYDQNTVSRLIRKDPDMLPKAREGVQKNKSYRWYNKQVASAVTQGIVQGEGVREIAQRIVDKTSEGNYKSAVRHARTAYTGAQNAGRMEGLHQAQELGIKVKKQWMATLDDRTRDTHAELDGQIRDIDEPFEVDGMEIDYPGDPTADPSLVYNCRCTLVYVYPDYPSEMQRRDAETGEIVGDMTYREWEEMKRGDGLKDKHESTEPTVNKQITIDDLLERGMSKREAIETRITELTGFDKEKAREVADAAQGYSSGMVTHEEDERLLNDYIDHAPVYSDVSYRGMRLMEDEPGSMSYDDFLNQIRTSGEYRPRGLDSWTDSEEAAKKYAWARSPYVDSVVLISEENHRATPFAYLSGYKTESEVLASSKSIWDVVRIEETTVQGARKAYVYVRERKWR